ncbi:MAG: ATP-binding protein [Spirochaetaceae bacterium]
MEIKSFTSAIYRSTILVSLITNILSAILLFFIFSYIIDNIYSEQQQKYNILISNYMFDVTNNRETLDKVKTFDSGNSDITLHEIEDLLEKRNRKHRDFNSYLLYKGENLPNDILPMFYSLINTDLNNDIISYKNKTYIIYKEEFNNYNYFQFYNITESHFLKNIFTTDDFLGFYYKDLKFNVNNTVEPKNSRNIGFIDSKIPNIRFYFSTQKQNNFNLLLLITILILSVCRFFATFLNSQRNIKKITKPLNDLVNNTEKLAAHEMSEKLNRFDYPYHEFKHLAEAFNKVLLSRELSEIKLFRSFEQMENVVHKRTQELITTNEQLTAAITKAEEANALKSQFLANISHEIRTPLNCIMGFCDIILTEDHSDTVTIQVKQILHESETLLHLINDFLDYSKIDAGKMAIVDADIDIRSLINSLMNSGQVQAGDKNLILSNKIDKLVPQIIVSDELRLYQIISNIFYNAIKFTPNGTVKIFIENLKSTGIDLVLQIKIIDSGIGIPDNRIESIFNKFEQVDGSLTRKYRGSGLGLTICKKIIEMMNGTIHVESQLNKGTIFTLEIPVKKHIDTLFDAIEKPVLDDDVEHTQGSHILLVEDYPVNQIVAKKHLEMDNHIVTVAQNGKEAIDKCDETTFDLILMDLQMPIMDGFKATQYIRGSAGPNRKIPILAMTANAMDTAKQTCLDSGMNGVITKPIRKKMFLKEVDKWLKISTI